MPTRYFEPTESWFRKAYKRGGGIWIEQVTIGAGPDARFVTQYQCREHGILANPERVDDKVTMLELHAVHALHGPPDPEGQVVRCPTDARDAPI